MGMRKLLVIRSKRIFKKRFFYEHKFIWKIEMDLRC